MARVYRSLAKMQEDFKKIRKNQTKVLKGSDKYAGLKECFKNVRKCNDSYKLLYY